MARPLKKVQGLYEKNPGTGIWYIRYRVGGQLVRKMIGDRGEALEALKKVTGIRTSGLGALATSASGLTLTESEQHSTELGKITIAQLCDEYLAHIIDDRNPRRPKDQINPPHRIDVIRSALGHRAAENLKGIEVEEWLISLARKPATLNRYKSTFSSIYQLAKKRGRVRANPVRDAEQFPVRLPKPRWLQPSEETSIRAVLQRWIDSCPNHHRLTRLFLQCHPHELTVALGTGMRKGNQYALRWVDVDFINRAINLPTSKNGKPLTLPIINDVFDALHSLKSIQAEICAVQTESKQKTGRVPKKMVAAGRVFNITENREWWAAALKEAKIADLRWHDLRHTFASRLVQAGVPLKLVQEACGHDSIIMTQRYAHLNQSILHTAMAVLNK